MIYDIHKIYIEKDKGHRGKSLSDNLLKFLIKCHLI
jgi:hypothetical protein